MTLPTRSNIAPEVKSSVKVPAIMANAIPNRQQKGGATQPTDGNWVMASEFIKQVDENMKSEGEWIEKAIKGTHAVKYLAAHQAFRLKSLLDSEPVMNAAGNLRGIVTSKNWRWVYELSVKYGDKLEDFDKKFNKFRPGADFMAWTNYLLGWGQEIDREWNSKEPTDVKASRLAFYATTAAVKMLSGTAHGITDLMVSGVEKSCQLAGRAGIKGAPTSTECSSYGDVARAAVTVYYQAIDDATTPDAIRNTVIDRGGDAVAAVQGWYKGAVRKLSCPVK